MVRLIKYPQAWLKKLRNRREQGQSLVEMAITTPILLLLLIGVFEVGWAIRSYLVLVDVNRETVRYAVKGDILDFDYSDPADVGYNNVLSHTMESLAGELPLEFINSPNASLIMTFLAVDTGLPCVKYKSPGSKEPKLEGSPPTYVFDDTCDCEAGEAHDKDGDGTPWFGDDDRDAHPGNYPQLLQTYGLSATTHLSDGDYQTIINELKDESNKLNCHLLKTNLQADLSPNMMFVTEAFYDQPQLLGMPLISNYFTDPVPLYAHTAMRLVPGREDDDKFPGCELYPMTFPENFMDSLLDPDSDGIPNFDPYDMPKGGVGTFDIYESAGSGNFGWMNWDPGNNSNPYIGEELLNPRLSVNDYTGLTPPPGLKPDPSDTGVNINDWVSGSTGVGNSNEVDDQLELLVGKKILIPVHDDVQGTGSGVGYHISHFAIVKITEVCLPRNSCPGVSGNDKLIRGQFYGYNDTCSIGGSSPIPPSGSTATPTVPPGSTSTPTPTKTPNGHGATATPTRTPTATATVPAGSTATPTRTPTTTPALHVQSISVSVQPNGQNYKGTVTLTVVDHTGNAINFKATVSGAWSQAINATVSKDTNPSGGLFTDTTGNASSPGPFTFCVTNIVASGWTYNASANNGTCATATSP